MQITYGKIGGVHLNPLRAKVVSDISKLNKYDYSPSLAVVYWIFLEYFEIPIQKKYHGRCKDES